MNQRHNQWAIEQVGQLASAVNQWSSEPQHRGSGDSSNCTGLLTVVCSNDMVRTEGLLSFVMVCCVLNWLWRDDRSSLSSRLYKSHYVRSNKPMTPLATSACGLASLNFSSENAEVEKEMERRCERKVKTSMRTEEDYKTRYKILPFYKSHKSANQSADLQ